MNRLSLPLLFFLALALLVIPASAQDEDINLVNFPTQLAAHWGISAFAAGLFLSSLLCFAFVLAIALLVKDSILPILLVGFSLMGFCIAIGWLPYWLMILLVLMIASMWASKITKSL